MILRFLGDMPEPQEQPDEQSQEPSTLRQKMFNTLSRKFSKSKLERELMDDANEVADIDAVDDDDDDDDDEVNPYYNRLFISCLCSYKV